MVLLSEIVTPIVYQLGAGAVGGFIVGYAIKKVTKIVAVIIGLFILALIVLGAYGVLTVDFGKLFNTVKGLFGQSGEALGWLTAIIAHLPLAGSFLVGLFLGWKIG